MCGPTRKFLLRLIRITARSLPIVLFLLGVSTSANAQLETDSCLDCHDDADFHAADGKTISVLADLFLSGGHGDLDCIDCHTQDGDYEDEPHYAAYEPVDCMECHDDVPDEFENSVHLDSLADGDMTCSTCHDLHPETGKAVVDPGCGNCHDDVGAEFAMSAHVRGRKRNGHEAARCTLCHGGHDVLEVSDPESPVYVDNIPNLCGSCHASEPEMTADFVRLPIVVPSYVASVHGQLWVAGEKTALCTDCHGVHDSRAAQDPGSAVHREQLSTTCGVCHEQVAAEYDRSIHGRAVALGIVDSPSCTDCHEEHGIHRVASPAGGESREQHAEELCASCHTNHEILAKYGIAEGVVETYVDSYHGWAIGQGNDLAATCTDCHNVHEILGPLNPASTVHADNLVATCGSCHEGANESFARSYTHASALEAKAPHEWVRLVYLVLIAVVLGGMAVHNFLIARFELSKHLKRVKTEPRVVRWRRAERGQHLLMLITFSGLAVTGFALRFPDSWWVHLIGLGGHEAFRAMLHRSLAWGMILVSVFHMLWIVATRRGRWTLSEMVPNKADFAHFGQNMLFHLRLRAERPDFGMFDYTQKAEYWAVVWGTWVMVLTGVVLWFPTLATAWAPSWIVRVSEVVHFYEAILAVSAILIWHLFSVIFLPSEYPMSTVWIDGKMKLHEWKTMHRGQFLQTPDIEVVGGHEEEQDPGPSVRRTSPPDEANKKEPTSV